MTNTRERIARAAYAVEQREFGGVDWDYPGDDYEGTADTAAAYEIADAAIAIVREVMLCEAVLKVLEENYDYSCSTDHGDEVGLMLDTAFRD